LLVFSPQQRVEIKRDLVRRRGGALLVVVRARKLERSLRGWALLALLGSWVLATMYWGAVLGFYIFCAFLRGARSVAISLWRWPAVCLSRCSSVIWLLCWFIRYLGLLVRSIDHQLDYDLCCFCVLDRYLRVYALSLSLSLSLSRVRARDLLLAYVLAFEYLTHPLSVAPSRRSRPGHP